MTNKWYKRYAYHKQQRREKRRIYKTTENWQKWELLICNNFKTEPESSKPSKHYATKTRWKNTKFD